MHKHLGIGVKKEETNLNTKANNFSYKNS
ncbi:MAG: hypothetical protein UZ11_BCD004002067, partial [Bacteroidetes bacterium OLB11]